MREFHPRRILMTTDTVGGVWNYATELAAGLGAYGIEVLLASLGGEPTPRQRADAARIPNLLLAESRYKLEWMEDPWEDVGASGAWLLELADTFQPDVVHLNSYGHGTLPWSAPVVLVAHSCVLSWWQAVHGTPAPAAWDDYASRVRSCIRSAGLLIAPSRAMLAAIGRHYGPGLPEARVVPNARDPRRYAPARKEPFVLTAGRLWDRAKNVDAVARLAARLSWPCYAAGDRHHPAGRVAELEGCRILGNLDTTALADWYARASIYALPARYEPFGLTVLEAALSGCALVLGDIDSLRENWEDAALFVPPGDTDALEAALRRLIADPDLRDEFAASALDRSRRFVPEQMAAAYVEAYRDAWAARRQMCSL
jgi:glycosyltransferase involved in cell wall biosynthesis